MEKTVPLTDAENISIDAINQFLLTHLPSVGLVQTISRYPGGFSNLTYCLQTANQQYILRKPPAGANIKSAHDMAREFKVLSLLKPHFNKIPAPLFFTEDMTILGTPFYIMEQLNGTILRAHNAPKMNIQAATFSQLSEKLIDTLVELHAIDIYKTALVQLGKPEEYITRQVDGWIKRYYAAETDTIESMNAVTKWLKNYSPIAQKPCFLHNDFKYDNIIFNDTLDTVVGVLDWEMATVGDPLMDFGAMLAYWFEEGEEAIFKQYNLTWLPGNLSRKKLIELYASKSGRDLRDIQFYYVFGLFKNAVIAQQIYSRWKQGHSNDDRFGALLPLVQLLGTKAKREVTN